MKGLSLALPAKTILVLLGPRLLIFCWAFMTICVASASRKYGFVNAFSRSAAGRLGGQGRLREARISSEILVD
jgi:hypothetical protein